MIAHVICLMSLYVSNRWLEFTRGLVPTGLILSSRAYTTKCQDYRIAPQSPFSVLPGFLAWSTLILPQTEFNISTATIFPPPPVVGGGGLLSFKAVSSKLTSHTPKMCDSVVEITMQHSQPHLQRCPQSQVTTGTGVSTPEHILQRQLTAWMTAFKPTQSWAHLTVVELAYLQV